MGSEGVTIISALGRDFGGLTVGGDLGQGLINIFGRGSYALSDQNTQNVFSAVSNDSFRSFPSYFRSKV